VGVGCQHGWVHDLFRWQFDLTWSLFEFHLERLEPDDFLWEPAKLVWTVRDGVPDWDEAELDPIPVPTLAWVTWHIGWWWSVTLDHVTGRPPRERTDIRWPGPEETVAWLRGLRDEWVEVLGTLDPDAPSTLPWQSETVGHVVAWLNAELMKNVTEIGQLRLLRAAGR
jgi:DinB family protein